MKRLRIFGAGVRATVAVDLIAWQFTGQIEVEGFYDDRKPIGSAGPGGFTVLGTVDDGLRETPDLGVHAFVALGTRSSAKAWALFCELQRKGVQCISLIPAGAFVSPSARIGDNALLMPGVFVGCEARIGHLFTAHAGSVVEHHSRIGDNVLLGPGVAMASGVEIGSHSFVGAGARLIPGTRLGEGVMLGAGSVVTRSLPSHRVAFGQPAAPVRPVEQSDEVPTETEVRELAGLFPAARVVSHAG